MDIIKHKEGADPAAVVYDTIQAGVARDCDIIICDTAGRLHNKKNLMDELNKIYRVVDKELPYADREILLVLDATTGQNGVNQAREFMNTAELTGIILTKLDGTARGGVVLTIKNELKLPVKFIGVGEGIDDLQPFDPAAFAASLFENVQERSENDENSLADLVNSDDYKNFTPAESNDESMETVKAFFERAFGVDDEQTENISELEHAEGQTDTVFAEKAATQAEKSEPQPSEIDKTVEETEFKENVAEEEVENYKTEEQSTFGEEHSGGVAQGGITGIEQFAEVEKLCEEAEKPTETAKTADVTETVDAAEMSDAEESADNADGDVLFVHPYAAVTSASASAASPESGSAPKNVDVPENDFVPTEEKTAEQLDVEDEKTEGGESGEKPLPQTEEPEKKKRRGLFGLFGRHS